jgi:ubiquinone/menaquinone biosynthesis C-methylase UbiE
MSERTFDDFDGFADDYRAIHSQNVQLSGADSYYFAEHKVLQLKNDEKDGNLAMLDVGCGDGLTSTFVEKHFPSWQTTGIDISEKSIAAAKKRNITKAAFQMFDGQHIPFENASFDVVFIAAVLHHIEFSLHQNLLNEMYRVLKPGGRLYLFEHNPLNPVTKYLVKTCVFDKDARLLSFSYAKKLIHTVNFTAISRKFILFFPRKGIFTKLLALEKHLSWLPFGGQYYFRSVK